MNMLTLFRSYLKTKVLPLDSICKAIRQETNKRLPHLKEKEDEKNKKKKDTPLRSIMGVSKTVIKPVQNIIGESKTKIPDVSDFIQSKESDNMKDSEGSKSITISLMDEGEIDLSAEEIPLEYNITNSEDTESVATGVSIEDIERMNRVADNPGLCSPEEFKSVQKTVDKLLGTKIFESQSAIFSAKLGKLLDECTGENIGNRSEDADPNEIDKWFYK